MELVVILLSLAACTPAAVAQADEDLKQWASVVVGFSTEYTSDRWGSIQALGSPDVYPDYGDLPGAWASRGYGGIEWIELGYNVTVKPKAVNVYETYHPGALVSVKAKNSAGEWVEIFSKAQPEVLTESRILEVDFKNCVTFFTNKIRLELDTSEANSWCEVDAVELVGEEDVCEPVS